MQSPVYTPPVVPKSKSNTTVIVVLVGCGCAFLMIPILAAILFPVFAQARDKARTASCLSNEKQIALGMLMYVQDYDETFPAATTWQARLDPYTKFPPMFHCPKATAEQPDAFGYAYDSLLSQLPLAYITSPPQLPLVYDSATLTQDAADAVTSLPVPPRHSNGNCLAFVDGHAKWMTQDALSQMLQVDPAKLIDRTQHSNDSTHEPTQDDKKPDKKSKQK